MFLLRLDSFWLVGNPRVPFGAAWQIQIHPGRLEYVLEWHTLKLHTIQAIWILQDLAQITTDYTGFAQITTDCTDLAQIKTRLSNSV